MVSCGVDKSIIFRNFDEVNNVIYIYIHIFSKTYLINIKIYIYI